MCSGLVASTGLASLATPDRAQWAVSGGGGEQRVRGRSPAVAAPSGAQPRPTAADTAGGVYSRAGSAAGGGVGNGPRRAS